jgi:transposase
VAKAERTAKAVKARQKAMTVKANQARKVARKAKAAKSGRAVVSAPKAVPPDVNIKVVTDDEATNQVELTVTAVSAVADGLATAERPATLSEESATTPAGEVKSELPEMLPNAAGIDIGSGEHYVAVPPDRPGQHVRHYAAETHGLRAMAEFLKEHGITHVGMEATGIYWIAPYNFLLEAGFTVCLLNPRSIKTVPGRKSDVLDCQWIQRLYSHGLAEECFVPPAINISLRELLRARKSLVQDRSADTNRMIKVLRAANINLERAVTDITGMTGLTIIEAIINGERDCLVLAGMRDRRCHKNTAEIAACLDGVYKENTVIMLKIFRDSFLFKTRQIESVDEEILELLKQFPSGPETGEADSVNADGCRTDEGDVASQVSRIVGNGVDLTRIPGISCLMALTILGEIGTDMTRWRSVKHFASWLGLCPGCKVSGGKSMSGATRKVRTMATMAFIMAALANRRSKNLFGEFYRRLESRLGPQKTLIALAHKIARTVYYMMKFGTAHVLKVMAEAQKKSKESQIAYAEKVAARVGMKLVKDEQVIKIA